MMGYRYQMDSLSNMFNKMDINREKDTRGIISYMASMGVFGIQNDDILCARYINNWKHNIVPTIVLDKIEEYIYINGVRYRNLSVLIADNLVFLLTSDTTGKMMYILSETGQRKYVTRYDSGTIVNASYPCPPLNISNHISDEIFRYLK